MTLAIRPGKSKRARSARVRLFGTDELTRGTRCAVIVAHPADEIVGAGCLISKLVDVSILHVTDGVIPDNDCRLTPSETRSTQARTFRTECLAALTLADVPSDQISDFLIPDRCASNYLVPVTRRILSFLQQVSADIVITHPYEGAHPDHDATAFATHAAVRLMKENGLRPPVVFEMGLYPSKDLQTRITGFLSAFEREVTTLLLDDRSRELKERMFACLDTSATVSMIDSEKFRRPPKYDFNRPPCPDKLHYENFDWAIRSAEWRALATRASDQLFTAKRAVPVYQRNPRTEIFDAR
jgi:N-acetylglucosamine malate deacetylase 2